MIIRDLTLTTQLSADLAACHEGAWSLYVHGRVGAGTGTAYVTILRDDGHDVSDLERARIEDVVRMHREKGAAK